MLASCAMHLPEPEEFATRNVTRSMPMAAESEGVDIYLLSDNLHTGLVFDLPWLMQNGYVPPPEIAAMPKIKQVTMSWGEKTAYIQKQWLNPAQVFKALCTPSDSVMEIIPIDWKVNEV